MAGVRDGAGEPVELGHDQGVAGADSGQGLVQAGSGAAGAGQALVEVDPVVRDAERGQGLALGGEVLQDGGAPGVAESECLLCLRCRRRGRLPGPVNRITLVAEN